MKATHSPRAVSSLAVRGTCSSSTSSLLKQRERHFLAQASKAWSAPSMPASSPAQRLVLLHIALALSAHSASTHLVMSRQSISPMHTGRTPGYLSSDARRLVISTRMAAQVGASLLSHITQAAPSSRRT